VDATRASVLFRAKPLAERLFVQQVLLIFKARFAVGASMLCRKKKAYMFTNICIYLRRGSSAEEQMTRKYSGSRGFSGVFRGESAENNC
jgi:hypothetical protein